MRYYVYIPKIKCSFLYIDFPYRRMIVKQGDNYTEVKCDVVFRSEKEFKEYNEGFFEDDERTKQFIRQYGLELEENNQ